MDINTLFIDGNEQSITSNMTEWTSVPIKIAEDNNLFSYFRSLPIIISIVEGNPIQAGLWNLRRLLKDSKFVDCLDDISSSDLVGNPKYLISFRCGGRDYRLNPTTIRYANNACNILNIFGEKILDSTFYEIGGGYGGECKIFNDFSKKVNKKRVSWNIFDLPSSYGMIKKWLSIFKCEANFISISDKFEIEQEAIVISNAALSEMRGDLLKDYIDRVVLRCKYGYFITNFDLLSKPYGGWDTSQFIEYLRLNGKQDVQEVDCVNYLSYFDKQATQKLIIFGAKLVPISKKYFIQKIEIYLYLILSSLVKRYCNFFLRH